MNEEYLETLGETAARSLRGEEWEQMDTAARRKAAGEMEWQIRDLMSAGFAVVDLNPDRRMSPERTAETADVWSECTRVLVYAAEGQTGLHYPGDVYQMLGSMKTGAGRLPELAERSSRFLHGQLAAGNLKLDGMGPAGDVADHVEAAKTALADAATAGNQLADAYSRAQNALSRVAYNAVPADDDQAGKDE